MYTKVENVLKMQWIMSHLKTIGVFGTFVQVETIHPSKKTEFSGYTAWFSEDFSMSEETTPL